MNDNDVTEKIHLIENIRENFSISIAFFDDLILFIDRKLN